MMAAIPAQAKMSHACASPRGEDSALARCAQVLMHDPALASTLAEMIEVEPFLAELAELARSLATPLDEAECAQIRQQNTRIEGWRPDDWPASSRCGWHPIALELGIAGPEWVWACGQSREDDAFHELSVQRLRVRPFNRLFTVRTPATAAFIQSLLAEALPLRGLIFHMSRCGSTLIAQALKAFPGVRVVSEPGLLDTAVMLAISGHDPQWVLFRATLAALSQPGGGHDGVVLKTDAWHALLLGALRECVAAPWLFVYRDACEVLASHAREPGRHTVPGMLPAALLGLDEIDANVSLVEYAARVIGAICAAVLPQATAAALINYDELPDALLTRVAPRFALDPTRVDTARLRDTVAQHAKRPYEPFVDDRARKRMQLDAMQRAAAMRWIEPHYTALERVRTQVEPQ